MSHMRGKPTATKPDASSIVAELRGGEGVAVSAAGTLPPEWQKMGAMSVLNIVGNNLRGTLPSE